MNNEYSRRDFLAMASVPAAIWAKRPLHHPKEISLDGATFDIIRNKGAARRYLLIHGDEETARQVLTGHIESHRGTAFLIRNHTRDVEIDGGKLDPNRMFSRPGAEANLRKLNPDWTEAQLTEALDLLDQGRGRLLDALFPPDNGLLLALHNNTEGYSVEDEIELSDTRSMAEPNNPHAFFLCTDPDDYKIMAKSPYNVVQEKFVRASDDGSLSRRAAASYIRYVNLEVRMGETARQKEMLDWAEKHLP